MLFRSFSGGGIIQLLILQLLHEKSDHGYMLMQRIQQLFGSESTPESGTIYTLLRRLESRNLLQSQWDKENSNTEKRVYTITQAGENQLFQGLRNIKLRRPVFDHLIEYYDTNCSKFQETQREQKEANQK